MSFSFSVSAAILFFTTFCFGAGLMSIALDLSKGHQLPNFLGSSLHPTPLLPPLPCSKCKKVNCTLHLHGEPWADYKVPREIDQALQEVLLMPFVECHTPNTAVQKYQMHGMQKENSKAGFFEIMKKKFQSKNPILTFGKHSNRISKKNSPFPFIIQLYSLYI